jgi:hypothetical protein
MPKFDWVPERIAAEKLCKKPRTLRKAVQAGKLSIVMTSVNGPRTNLTK